MISQFNRKNGNKLVVGVGSPLVDILANEDDHFLSQTKAVKGGMIYVDKTDIDQVVALSSQKPSIVPGGSACNTTIGVGRLGGQARFVGKCGEDDMGQLVREHLNRQNVEPHLFISSSPTGRVCSIITPDAQRSMLTFLGAASEVLAEDITDACFSNAAIVHVEGYLLFNYDFINTVLQCAVNCDALVSLDLASFTVVEEDKASLNRIIDEFVDILIANEDEAKALTGYVDEAKAIRALSERAEFSVLKVGGKGSYIAHENRVLQIPPAGTGGIIDTTGAGDLWASGFLYGLVNGYSLEECGKLGSACGYEVCKVIGPQIDRDGWIRIKRLLK
jgi:sugar/nucleoside kinase (ribokinase family)